MKSINLNLTSWGVTNACNLSCIYCYRDAGERALRELTTEEGKKLLRDIKLSGAKMVVLTGGEPLLREDIFELAKYGSSLGLIMLLATNGTLISRDIALRVKESGIKIVSVNLNGSKPEIHDGITKVKGSFKRTLNGIRYCIEEGVGVQANITVTKLNYHDVLDLIKFVESLGVKFVHVFSLIPVGRGSDDVSIPPSSFAELLKKIYEYQNGSDLLIKPTCSPYYWAYIVERKPRFLETFLRRYPTGCTAGVSYIYISPIGDVYPCPYLPVKVGNVREKPFTEIWKGSDVLMKLRCRDELKGRCGSCTYRDICGGCRAKAYVYYKDIMAEDPSCILEEFKFGKNY